MEFMKTMENNIPYGCHNIDCLDGFKRIKDNSIDLLITDPPYKIVGGGCGVQPKKNECKGIFNRRKNVEKRTDWTDNARKGTLFKHNDIKIEQWIGEVFRVLKNGSHCYIMVNSLNLSSFLTESEKVGFKLHNILIWKKSNATPNQWYMKNCEYILFLRKGKAKPINNLGTKVVIEGIPNPKKKKHPTEKPIELMKVFIENSSKVGDVVLDPFGGVFATYLAAKELKRECIIFEKDEEYFNIGKERVESVKSNPKQLFQV